MTSNINGLLQAKGSANLFLINPNGIIFGPNASLKIGGSFLATTANSLNFADGTQFSATTTQTTSLLTVSVPIGLQFGANAGSIRNLSQASLGGATNSLMPPAPVGLEVQTGQTLALIGGDVALEGGNLTATGGQIELGSVADNSLVKLNPTEKGWALSYEGVQKFQNIRITPRNQVNGHKIPSYVDVSGDSRGNIPSGNIQLQGRQIMLTGGSQILSTNWAGKSGGSLTVTASDFAELIGINTHLYTQTNGFGNAGNIKINTGKLLIQNGAQVSNSTVAEGSGGQLTVNATDSVKVVGSSLFLIKGRPFFVNSSLLSETAAAGKAGDITINTGRLLVQDGAQVTASSSGRLDPSSELTIPGRGRGGNVSVNASDSVQLSGTTPNGVPAGLFTDTLGGGAAGNIAINTGQLIIRDRAVVDVGSVETGLAAGTAGHLEVRAPSILLDNRAVLSAETRAGQGNINLDSQDLLLRHSSKITTSATGTATGGNITIKTGVLTALEDSDIRANADEGPGGRVIINAQGIFGTEFRQQDTPLSDITASSTLGPKFSGTVQINTLGINPSFGLVNLPVQPVDVTGLIAQGCPADVGSRGGKFVVTGRGGLPPTPREALRSEPTLVDLGTTVPSQENHASDATSTKTTSSEPAPLVEATGWVTNALGEVVLVATAPSVTSDIPWLTPATCHTQ